MRILNSVLNVEIDFDNYKDEYALDHFFAENKIKRHITGYLWKKIYIKL